MNNKFLIINVPHGKSEKLTRAAIECGSKGGTILSARALSKTNFGAILGIGESLRDLIFIIVEEEIKDSVQQGIIQSTSKEKTNFGELFSLDVDWILKSGILNNSSGETQNILEEKNMNESQKKQMITVIVNKGFADDVMFAARKAGASGGTVLNARGTAKETDEKFFGVHIIPEKEMLIIVVDGDKKEKVLNSIKELEFLKQPGMGIAYSTQIEDFYTLGKQKKIKYEYKRKNPQRFKKQ